MGVPAREACAASHDYGFLGFAACLFGPKRFVHDVFAAARFFAVFILFARFLQLASFCARVATGLFGGRLRGDRRRAP